MRACGIIFMVIVFHCGASIAAHESLSKILPRRMTSEYAGLTLPNLYGIANAVVGGASLLAFYFYLYGEEALPSAEPDPYDFPTGLDESYAPIGHFFVTHRPVTVVFFAAASLFKKYKLRHQLGPMCFLTHEAYRRAALKLSEEGQKPNSSELTILANKLEESEKLEGQNLYNKLVSSLEFNNGDTAQFITNLIILADQKGILYRLCIDESNSNKSPVEIIKKHVGEILEEIKPDKRD